MIVRFSEAAVRLAGEVLREGGLCAFPTETVYGLGARADQSEAVKKIYAAKGRPSENPSIVHVATAEAAFALCSEVPEVARKLAEKFWPGPLTLVLKVLKGAVAPEATAFGDTIALRVPSRPEALAILREVSLPIAAPSANRSTYISPTEAAHVDKSLGDRVDLIVDGGPTDAGIESTIVDLSGDVPRLLRHGSVSWLSLIELLPQLTDRASLVTSVGERAPAPGTQAKHYSPTTRFELVEASSMLELLQLARSRGLKVGALVTDPALGRGAYAVEVLPLEPNGFAQRLYAAMHSLDEAECDLVLAESPPDGPEWAAVRDRMTRAAHK